MEVSSEASNSTTYSAEDRERWQQRIQNVQRERATPEVIARIQSDAHRKQRTMRSVKTAKRLEKANYLSSASNMMNLQMFSASSAPSEYSARTRDMEERAQTLQQCSRLPASEEEECNAELMLDSVSLALTREVCQAQEMAQVTPQSLNAIRHFDGMDERTRHMATTEMESEMVTLLKQLEVEPTEEAELTAKYALFETFLATIVKIREETMTFWRENCDLFEGAARAAAQNDINKIDNPNTMGIPDDPRKWFVYLMTKKANENCAMIGRTLATLRARLEMIQSEDGNLGECPFCLDDMTPMGQEGTCVLGCCHRVCKVCWDHWLELKGPRHVFCPLCRHEEFVADVLSTPVGGRA